MANADPSPLTAKQQRQIDEARDTWLILQAAAEGYRQNVRWLEQQQGLLDILGVLIAIWLVVVLWGIQEMIPAGKYREWVTTVVNVGGTVLAIAQVSLTIASWRSEWRGRADKHRQLANEADKLAACFLAIFQDDKLDEGKLARAKQDYQAFVTEENQPLGGMPQWARRHGFQHVGRRHPTQNIRCNDCGRNWEELRVKLQSLKRFVPGKCNNCGVTR